MLKVFRDNLKSWSWLIWVFVAATIFLWVLMDIPGLFDPQSTVGRNAVAAQAGSAQVTYGEYESAYRQLEQTYSQLFQGKLPEGYSARLKVQALDQALNEKLLIVQAKKMGLTVPDEELRKRILEYPAFQKVEGGFIGEKDYASALRRAGYGSPKEFEAAIRDSLLYEKINGVLRASAYVTDDDVHNAFREEVERAKLSYLLLPYAQPGEAVEVSPQELAAYFAEHQDVYRLPEQRKVDYLLVDAAQLRATMTASQEEIQAYYDSHQDEFQQEEQVRARHILITTDERTPEEAAAEIRAIRQRIENGGDFATVATEVSEDPGSAANGGDLRFFSRGRMVPQFEEAAFGAQIGELVGPVVTPFGAHLIQVTERRAAGVRPLEEVQAQVSHKILTERVEEAGKTKAGELLSRLKDAGKATREGFEAIAGEDEALRFAETAPFGRQDLIPGIGRSEEFAAAAFDAKVGDVAGPTKVPRGWAILSVAEVLEPRVPQLSEVEGKVQAAAQAEKQKKLAREKLEGARAQLEDGRTLAEVAASLGVEVKESQPQGAQGSIPELGPTSTKIISQALTMNEGEIGGPEETPQGAVLFQVTERQRMDAAEFELRKGSTRERLENERFAQVQASALAQLKRDLGTQNFVQIEDPAGALTAQ
jgi:peptidyl-prolyl cis-trans isomerase D